MGDLVRRFFAPLQAIDWPKAFLLDSAKPMRKTLDTIAL